MQQTETTTEQLPIKLRAATTDDASLIYSSWLKSNRDSGFAKDVGTDRYFNNHKQLVADIVNRAGAIVACNPDDPTTIYGWICVERLPAEVLVVHYVYVKYTFRQLGVARRLWQAINPDGEEVLTTHAFNGFRDLRRAGYPLVYDPYLLFKMTRTP